MVVGSHLKALLWKNWLLWKRNLAGSLCELLFPIVLLLGLLAIRYALPPEDKDAKSYLDDGEKVSPVLYYNDTFNSAQLGVDFETPLPFRWCKKTIYDDPDKWTFAFVPKNDLTEYLAAQINETFVQVPSDVGIKYFEDEDDLEDYITDSDYDDDDSVKICFAVVIDHLTDTKADYKIRFNSTDTDPDNQTVFGKWFDIFLTTRRSDVNEFTRKVETQYQTDFLKSGFIQIMNTIENYILRELFGHTNSYISVAFVPMHGQDYVEDNFTQGFAGVLGFFMFVTSMVPVARMIGRIVTEKESKVREAMKMMGLSDTPYWVSWVIMYTLIYFISAIGCTLVGIPIFKYSNKFVVFLIFFLYGLSCISFSMLISSFFTKTKTAILVGIVAFFVSYFSIFAIDENTPNSARMGLSLFNTIAMALGFFTLLTFEGVEEGSNFSNLDDRYLHTSVQDCLIMLAVDTIIYALLAFYFDKVIPSEYGTKLPWYFPFSPSYWRGRSLNDDNLNETERRMLLDEMNQTRQEMQENIEGVDNSLQRQIESGKAMVVRGLRKHFGNKIAVDGIDLEMYEGQIFALLGHNGAGKTTTISMLTGMLGPTAGEMTVNKLKFDTDMEEIRQKLGVCPQHDVLFKELTVTEHLYMFARFKGMIDNEEIKNAVNEKIREVDLEEKKNTKAMNLSGGQKRKLSLAIALIGGSTIIMLDEPTSGMDLTARRKMWDMLKNAKQGRIIILTTHYMEEADILADRIAIMAEGQVRCLGSSLFLKNRYGVGYNLTISKKINVSSSSHSRKIIDLVTRHIPDAELLADASAEISFQLPLSSSPRFKEFFTDLDRNLDSLDLLTYAISVTTLEEVFLRVARGDDERGVRKSQEGKTLAPDLSKDHTTEINLTDLQGPDKDFNIAEHRLKGIMFFSHFGALIKKRWIYSLRDYKGLLMEIFLPIIVITLGLALLTQFSFMTDQEKKDLTIDLYDTPQNIIYNPGLYTSSSGFYQEYEESDEIYIGKLHDDDNKSPIIKQVMDIFSDQQDDDIEIYGGVDDITNDTIEYLDKRIYKKRDTDPYRYGSYYFNKAESNLTDHVFEVVVFHNSSAYQSVPVFYTAMSKAVLTYAKDPNNLDPAEYKYEVANHPLPLTKKQQKLASNAGSFYVSMIFAVGIAFIPTGVITYIVKEKENNVKHQHLVSGISIPAYWISNFFWDILKYELVAVVSVLMITAFDLQSMTESSNVYSATWVIFIASGPAIVSFAYVFSFFFKTYSMAQFTIFMHSLLFGAVIATITWFLKLINDDTRDAADVLEWIFRALSPVFCFSYALMNITK
jgi:ATP-binding cassette subfamily A (ABC1) protein 3